MCYCIGCLTGILDGETLCIETVAPFGEENRFRGYRNLLVSEDKYEWKTWFSCRIKRC